MKKIITNRVYDTDKAVLIGGPANDQLFKKKTGEYFFFVRNQIIPTSFESARSWAEETLSFDAYEAEFELIPLDGNKTRLNVSVSPEHATVIKRIAAERGISVSQIFDDYIDSLEQ